MMVSVVISSYETWGVTSLAKKPPYFSCANALVFRRFTEGGALPVIVHHRSSRNPRLLCRDYNLLGTTLPPTPNLGLLRGGNNRMLLVMMSHDRADALRPRKRYFTTLRPPPSKDFPYLILIPDRNRCVSGLQCLQCFSVLK